MTWILQIISDDSTEQDIYIDRDMLVGRHQEADIRLQHAEVSRRHAAFLLRDQALWLQDLNSSNGTFVNTVRIVEETQLHSGDEIAFAQLKFKLHLNPSVSTPAEPSSDAAVVSVQEDVVGAQVEVASVQQDVAHVAETAAESVQAEEAASINPAAQMNEQGMPSMADRAADTQLSENGVPEHVAVPKPAPIPEGIDLNATAEQQPIANIEAESVVEKAAEQKKNTSVGLMTVIVLLILAVIAWLMFK